PAIFVNNDGHMRLIVSQIFEDFADFLGLGYEIWRTHYLTDRDIVGSPGREEVLRVQRPDDVVDIILIDRNPGVSALYYDPDYFGEFGLGFSINRIRTRN